MNQSESLEVTCKLPKEREESPVQGAIGFASHWLENWREIFEPVIKPRKRNRIICR